jgi:hypothetical protein
MQNLSHYKDHLCELKSSLLIKGIEIGEMSKLGWPIGLVRHAIWADSLYFLYLLVTFNFQNTSFIPAYPMTLFIGMLG